ncbi:DUF402 domain-containing protein [Chloroflexota bacterium]
MERRSSFKEGRPIVLREIWQDKIWLAVPAIVLQELPEMLAFYTPAETIGMIHRQSDGTPTTVDNLINSEWILEEFTMDYSRLKLIIPGTGYSVILFRNPDGTLRTWYINMENRVRHTTNSYDDTDLLLDITIKPDLSEWRWLDEDELEAVIAAGLVSREKSEEMYTEGEQLVRWILSGESPFNKWVNWQPEKCLVVPVLPDGWNII